MPEPESSLRTFIIALRVARLQAGKVRDLPIDVLLDVQNILDDMITGMEEWENR